MHPEVDAEENSIFYLYLILPLIYPLVEGFPVLHD